MLKKIMLITMLLGTSSAYAMDELSSIPEGHEKFLGQIQETFKINKLSKKTKIAIYDVLKVALKDGWQSFRIDNSSLSSSKFKDDTVQIYELIIANSERVNIVSFTYFPKAKQIFYSRKEFVEASSSLTLDLFKKQKSKKSTKVIGEKDNYGFTQKEGYLEFAIHHIDAPNGGISYIHYGLIDVK